MPDTEWLKGEWKRRIQVKTSQNPALAGFLVPASELRATFIIEGGLRATLDTPW